MRDRQCCAQVGIDDAGSDSEAAHEVHARYVRDHEPDVVCFGEVLLRLSSPGKELLLQSPRFDAHVGGAEANVAVSLSKLGHRARW